ncbi:TRAP-type C4-dicarboxylate transport system, substrate-binding protein [Paracoccus halophilus]|uniref:TRAP-type C4-dicarboxylate transport system, substrate-binding protein n=1 Tax=Paracoccus halophilus TaxID=376733 RepID=A0A1I0SSA4_9RHOB|nr:TRAP transporter substrate-binding protein [Paracoccus halophilus]SFA42410.1 TRAP-type C4-dicarboxylate transport system, substrate-binding protein [Paracoccus halophilus]
MKLTDIAGIFGLGAAVMTTAAGAEVLKLADFQPSTHPYMENVYKPFNDEIAAATGGDLTVRVYSGGELGPGPAEQYNRAVDGVADIVFGLPGYTASTFPLTLVTELPGIIEPETGTQRMLDNLDALSQEYRRVKLIGLWSNAPNLLFMADRPVRTLDDLRGMKIRVPSRNAGLVIEAWGASPVSMPAPDIYNAMQTGVLDGAFIDGTTTFSFRLSEVTKYITTGMDSSLSSFFLLMNRDSFGDLDEAEQAAVIEAGRNASLRANRIQLEGAERGLAEFAATAGKEVIELSPEEADRFNKAAAPVVQRILDEVNATGRDASGYVAALRGE